MFIVREDGKNGGTPYATFNEAYKAAWEWAVATGIRCEVVTPKGAVMLVTWQG